MLRRMARTFLFRYRGYLIALVLAVLLVAALVPSPTTSLGAFVYELLRRCPDEQDAIAASDFYVIGHRGAAGHAVENTIASMDAALRLGANAIEIDLCMTRDSAIVLWHDWMPDDPIATARQKGTETDVVAKPVVPDDDDPMHRPVHELTLAELRANYGYALKDSTRRLDAAIPTLEEFLAWSAGKSQLRAVYLDIKVPDELASIGPAMIARIERALAAAPHAYEVVYLVAFEKVYAAVEPMLPDGNIAYDREPPGGLVLDPAANGSTPTAIARGNGHASTIIPITSTFGPWTTARRIARADVLGSAGRVRVVTGTMNDPEKLACLVQLGVAGIFTDFPERLRRIVGDPAR